MSVITMGEGGGGGRRGGRGSLERGGGLDRGAQNLLLRAVPHSS